MASISIDVDIDNFDTADLITEVIERMSSSRKSRVVSERQKKDMLEVVNDLYIRLSCVAPSPLPYSTLDDIQKHEHLFKVWDNYTPDQIEKLLP